MAEKIIGIYKITNTITNDFYIGSSKDIKRRWKEHQKPSVWKKCSNNPMYLDMLKYGTNKFSFQVIKEVEPEYLKETEQQFIEMLKPTYNSNNANGFNIKKYQKEYHKSDKYKEYQKEYYQHKSKNIKKRQNKYNNQPCYYNNEILTLAALKMRFKKSGIEHPTIEAKKYLVL